LLVPSYRNIAGRTAPDLSGGAVSSESGTGRMPPGPAHDTLAACGALISWQYPV